MANSIKKYVFSASHTSNTAFPAPNFLTGRQSDIKVKVGKEELQSSQYSLGTNQGGSWEVKFNAGFLPNEGDAIRIYRQTNHTGRLVDFVDGSLLTSETLDLDSDQLFNIAIESYDKGDEATIGSESFYYSQGTDPNDDVDVTTDNYSGNGNVDTGTLWYDTSNTPFQLKVWNGSEWQAAAPARVTKKYGTTNSNGKTAVDSHPSNSAFSQFTDAAFNSDSSLYLNGVKLVQATNIVNIPAGGDYTVDNGTVVFLDLSSASDILVSETFSGHFSSSVFDAETNAAASASTAAQSAAGALLSSQFSSDNRLDAEDARDDAAKYASHPKNSTFSTHDNSATGQYSAKHYAETAADSAATASSAATNANVQAVGADLVSGLTSNILTVANKIDKVEDVADKITEVESLAGKTSEMTTLTTGTALSDINTVAGKATEVGQVAAIDSEIADVALKLSEIDAVEAKLSDIEDVAEVATKVSDVATAIPDITTVATEPYKSKIETVYTHRDAITDVGGEITKVTTVANDLTGANNIGTLANPTYKQQVTDVANQIGAVGTVSASINNNDISTLVSNVENIGTVADISDDVTNLSKSTGDMSTLVSKLGQTNDLAGAVNDAQASATAAAGSASTATTQATAAAGSASTAATHAANLGSVVYQNLTAIAESKSVTATDVFVYDTSKDSDGGAWRNRTQGTSWYNEALNTSTRGATKKFPAVAVIVAENGSLTIFDGDDPSMPMWMVANVRDQDNTTGAESITALGGAAGQNLNTVTARNGQLFIGGEGQYSSQALLRWDFISDKYGNHSPSVAWSGWTSGTIAERNSLSRIERNTLGRIINAQVWGVAVTVLPNAPIDPDTGLPVPTIAVATESGVSVIKDDGSVVDITGQVSGIRAVAWMGDKLVTNGVYGDATAVYAIPSADQTHSVNEGYYVWQYAPSVFAGSTLDPIVTKEDRTIVSGCAKGLQHIHHKDGDSHASLSNQITTSYNTGWMNGDIKLATLMDTTAETISAPELVTNGDFSSFGSNMITNGEFPNNADGWDLGSNFTWDNSGRVERTSGATNSYFSQNINIEAGKTYRVTYDVVHTSGNSQSTLYTDYGNGSTTVAQQFGSGTVDVYFTATQTKDFNVKLYGIGDFRGYWDNVVIREVTGWNVGDNAIVSINSSGQMVIDRNNESSHHTVYQELTTEVGKTYNIGFDLIDDGVHSNFKVAVRASSSTGSLILHQDVHNGNGTKIPQLLSFTATSTSSWLSLAPTGTADNTGIIDNVSIVEVVADRSVNDNGLNIVGNLQKDNVASGAELVCYKFDTDTNQLVMPSASSIGDPTHDYCWMWWQRGTDMLLGTSAVTTWQQVGSYNPTTAGYYFSFGGSTGNKILRINRVNSSLGTGNIDLTGSGFDNELDLDSFNHFCVVKKGNDIHSYINGKLKRSLIDNTLVGELETTQGGSFGLYESGNGDQGRMTLLKISSTAPTAEQIAKIYRDEKPLFQAGAKCTLSSSDNVKAIAYDEDLSVLHVSNGSGSSAYRDEFVGLQNVVANQLTESSENVSACNGLVVED